MSEGQSHLAMGDLDGDGKDEVVLASTDPSIGPEVYAYTAFGEVVPGWPRLIPLPHGISGLAVGDLDFDGESEVVVPTFTYDGGWVESPVYVYEGDGSLRPSWPSMPTTGTRYFANEPTIADLDGDLRAEIIGAEGGRLLIMEADGSMFDPSWIMLPFGPTGRPAVGDLDGDGWLEIVCPCPELVIFWSRYRTLTQTPDDDEYSDYLSPRIADFDGDGEAEIAVWTHGTGGAPANEVVHVLDASLNEEPWWPVVDTGTAGGGPGDLSVADLDADGDLEMIVHIGAFVHVWDIPSPGGASPRIEWGVLGGPKSNFWYHDGETSPSAQLIRGDVNDDGDVSLADAITLLTMLFGGAGGTMQPDPCPARSDIDNSGGDDIADVIYLLSHLFIEGPSPIDPYPTCGPVPLSSALPCEVPSCP